MIGVSVGQYECRRLLGEGGTGMVYLAVHRVLQTPRAVKVLRSEWTGYPELVTRFVNEARAAAAIRHRNIIAVHDCAQLESGEWYILLDFLEGGTLTRFMESHGGPMAMHDAMHVLAEIANGLQAAHDHRIVHRDLKPDNVFLSSRDGNPRAATLLDFGVAKLGERAYGASDGTSDRATGDAPSAPGGLLGTPVYMAPEQLRGEAVGPAADVFALGVIAYQMMSGGALPFQFGDPRQAYLRCSPVELYQRITLSGPEDLLRHNPRAPAEWRAIIGAALHPDPRRRVQTPRELALRLAEATPGDGFCPSGVALVQSYARELLEVGTSAATVRAPATAARGDAREGRGGVASARREIAKYQVLRKIGAGGMGEVFEGTLLGADGFARKIAIKRVHAEQPVEPHVAAMFGDEARLAAQLIHPNLVEVLDFDRDVDGRPFLVMEYVDGPDLAALLRGGALPPPVALFIASEMLYGLGYAHELPQRDGKRGLVHRDLSPHNVLLSRQGAVKVSDFGIAKALEGRGAVQLRELCGKPPYMSPEQVHAQPLDERSDLFAVGIILWEMLTGRRLFVGSTGTEVMASVTFKRLEPPSSVADAVSRELDAVVMKLLERDKERRYGSAREANEALMACPLAPRDGRRALQQLIEERAGSPSPPTGDEEGPGGRASAGAGEPGEPGEPGEARGAASLARRRWRWSVLLGPTAVAAALAGALITRAPDGAGQAITAPSPGEDQSERAADRAPPPPAPAPPPSAEPLALGPAHAETRGARGETGRSAAERPAHGTLLVSVRPWAAVSVDGRSYGETPVTLKLPPGEHRVLLVHPRGRRAVTVTIAAARQTLLEEEL